MNESAEKTETPVGKSDSETKESQSRHRMLSPLTDMESWFQHMFPRMGQARLWDWPPLDHLPRPFEGKIPRVDVIERDNEILLKAEMPGVSKDNLEVTTTRNTVTLKGTSRYEHKQEDGDFHRREMSEGVFARTVTLPAEVAGDKAEARFRDGLLELTLPKLPPKEGHKIDVK